MPASRVEEKREKMQEKSFQPVVYFLTFPRILRKLCIVKWIFFEDIILKYQFGVWQVRFIRKI